MRTRLLQLVIVLCIIALPLPLAGLAQDATPPSEVAGSCGQGSDALEKVISLEKAPATVIFLYTCASENDGLLSYTSVLQINLGTGEMLMVRDGSDQETADVQQTGTTTLQLVSGQLKVTPVKACAISPDCTVAEPPTGYAKVGTPASDLSINWQPITGEFTILPGMYLELHDMTVNYTIESTGGVMLVAMGVDDPTGGGCNTACWHP